MLFIYLFQFLSNFIYICFLNISLKGLYVGNAYLMKDLKKNWIKDRQKLEE
jgi:hypothetical protein